MKILLLLFLTGCESSPRSGDDNLKDCIGFAVIMLAMGVYGWLTKSKDEP